MISHFPYLVAKSYSVALKNKCKASKPSRSSITSCSCTTAQGGETEPRVVVVVGGAVLNEILNTFFFAKFLNQALHLNHLHVVCSYTGFPCYITKGALLSVGRC